MGAAYVFIKDGSAWLQQAKLVANDASFSFGASVALQVDTAVVGSPRNSVPGADAGNVYVFDRSGPPAASFVYDSRGRLAQEKRSISGQPKTFSYAYDAADRLSVLTQPWGEKVTQTYNDRGLPATVSSDCCGTPVTAASYNALGLLTSLSLGNGVTVSNSYYGLEQSPGSAVSYGRLYQTRAVKGATVLQDLAHTWDANGNLASRTDGVAAQTESFAYDFLDRLTSVSGAYTESYTYNAIGNITSKSGVAYTYGSAKPHAVTAVGTTTYAYDANGNMTTRGTQTLTWDVENRLKEVKNGATTLASFTYDADGQRITQTAGGQATAYYSKYHELNRTTYEGPEYYFFGGTLIARNGWGGNRYLLQDHLGSTRVIADNAGVEVGRLSYFPFGATRSSSGTIPADQRYTGQRLDSATGLYYYNARYYDPQIGRFISADTIIPSLDPQHLNRYSYVRNNPVRYNDPDGRCGLACYEEQNVVYNDTLAQTGSVAAASAAVHAVQPALIAATFVPLTPGLRPGGATIAERVGNDVPIYDSSYEKVVQETVDQFALLKEAGLENDVAWSPWQQQLLAGYIAQPPLDTKTAAGFDREAFALATALGTGANVAAIRSGGGVTFPASGGLRIGTPVRGVETAPGAPPVPEAVTGFTRHGINNLISRDGHGVSNQAFLDTVRNPLTVQYRPQDRLFRISGENAVVSVNAAGQVVNAWARNRSAWRY